MLFSICIPVYNTSQYLDECLQSVLNQTEKDYEIVLVNDGSTDHSGEICDRYAAEYPNIRVIHKQNEGLLMTRRRGFQEARGDYFICLDSDDYWISTQVLSRIRSMIEKEKCDLVFFNYIAGKEDPTKNQNIVLFNLPDGHVFKDNSKAELYQKLLIGRDFNAIWIKAVSRKVLDIDVDYGKWKSDICRAEDMFQSYPILNNAMKIGYIKEPFVYYRWTPSSISNNPKLKFYNAFRTIYQREDEYIPQWNLSNDVIKKAKLRRIPNILGIIITGYHTCKQTGKLSEWNEFLKEVSYDPFFKELCPLQLKNEISIYYRWLCKLILKRKVFLLTRTLDAYQWYSTHIKRKR